MFYYLNKDSLKDGEVVVILQTQSAIPNYKEITNQGELVEYSGDNIPAQWEYDVSEDTLYDLNDKPSPYHELINKNWVVADEIGFKTYCNNRVNEIKAEVLEYGFDFEGHQQKCRDKDITFMAITALMMFLVKTFLNKDITKKWYFQDNYSKVFNLQELVQFMFQGSMFVQAVYDTENHYKTLKTPVLATKEAYLIKLNEIQAELMGGKTRSVSL